VIGVDGGGTKTAAVVVVLAESRARADLRPGACALVQPQRRSSWPKRRPAAVGLPAAIAALREALTQALASAQKTFADVAAACLCLAGVDRPDDRARVAAAVRAAIYPFPRLLIYNDAAAALAAGTGRLLGIVVIAGTGTIAYGYDAQGRMARAAGWGALLADHGGGFWIGLEGLHAVVRAADGRGPATALSERVLTHLGLRAPEDLIAWTYGEPFECVASPRWRPSSPRPRARATPLPRRSCGARANTWQSPRWRSFASLAGRTHASISSSLAQSGRPASWCRPPFARRCWLQPPARA
jgi:N-acetylglucosamine kinase-like BadF-type ATPase